MFKYGRVLTVLFILLGLTLSLPMNAYCQEYLDPDVLVYAAMSQERAPVVAAREEALMDYISKVTGKSVTIYITTSYAAQIEAMAEGWAHFANFGPFAYILASERTPDLEVIATYSNIAFEEHWIPGGPGYVGFLITKKGTEYDSIESLRGATVGFPDPASTSGYLLPEVVFTRDAIDGESLQSFFGEIVFTGSHDAVILAVVEGRIDAGFTWDSAPYRLWQRGETGKPADEFNLLWVSPYVPLDPYTVSSKLHPSIIANIKKAYLTWHEQPEAGSYFEEVGATHFVEMSGEDYQIIRDLRDAMN